MSERDLIDLAVRQYAQPQLELDADVLVAHLDAIKADKQQMLDALGVEKSLLMSDAKFGAKLIELGVTPREMPTMSASKSKWSFAKVHPQMQWLTDEHPDPLVRKFCEARLAFKSTLEETRAERFLSLCREAAVAPPQYFRRPQLPAAIMYYAAHTGRYGGGDKVNLQNLGRGSFLRQAIVAPEGKKIVAADLAQIEARLTACFCGQWSLVEQFRDGVDVYANFASQHYGYKVNADDHPKERFVGKTGILSLGFQSGAEKFYTTMNDVFQTPISMDEALQVVATYRKEFNLIRNMWYDLSSYIEFMASGRGGVRELGPVEFMAGKVVLPNGMPIFYPELEVRHGEYTYLTYRNRAGHHKKLYGGALLENIIQALARIIMTRAVDKFLSHNIIPAMSVHDELVFVVDEDRAELMAAAVTGVMEAEVPWMKKLPVKCEAKIGDNYAECK